MRKRILLISVIIFLLNFINLYAEEWPFGFPEAKLKVKNVVPFGLLRKIALKEAKKTWGIVIPLSQIPCCDSKGNIVAYMFIFQKREKNPKTFKKILEEVKEGRKLYKKAEKELEMQPFPYAPRNNEPKEKSITHTGIDISSAILRSIPPSESFRKAHEKFEFSRKKKWGIGEYGTLLVSARYDLIPIPVRWHGLPDYYAKGDLIQNEARNILGGDPKLTRIYLGGPWDQWFEFTDSNGGKVLVDPFSLKTFPSEQISELMPKEIRMKCSEELMREKWKKLEESVKEK